MSGRRIATWILAWSIAVPTVAACSQSTASQAASQAAVAPATPTAGPATSPVPVIADPIRRVDLPGSAPAAIAIAQDAIWVYSIESGDITSVGPVLRTIHVGGMGSHLVVANDGRLIVGRFDNGGSGDFLLRVDPASGGVDGFTTGPLGSVAVGDDGNIYALEKAGRLLRVDPVTGGIIGSAAVQVDDEHMEVVIADGAAWSSSDHTPLRRVSIPNMEVTDTIEVGGGIPFVVAAGRIWGARPGTMWVFDPATKAVVRTVPLPGVDEILAMDVDEATNEAWFGVRMTGRVGAVLRMNLTTGELIGSAPVSLPAAIKIVGPEVDVASYLDNELLVYARS